MIESSPHLMGHTARIDDLVQNRKTPLVPRFRKEALDNLGWVHALRASAVRITLP